MPTGPLGDGATDAGPSVTDGIQSGQYKSFEVLWPSAGVCELVLSRPKKLNAINIDFIRELHQVLDVLQYPHRKGGTDHPVRVLIIRGTERGFCAGIDLGDSQIHKSDHPLLQNAFSAVIKKLREIPQPFVCGVNGVAAGAGMSLTLAADVRIGMRGCRFIPSFTRLGVGGGELGTSYFLPRIVGRGRASSILLTGREINTEQADMWGLISQVVSTEDELAHECRAVATEMLSLSPKGLKLTKLLLNGSQDMPLAAVLEREDLAQTYLSADKESVAVGKKHVGKFKPKSKL